MLRTRLNAEPRVVARRSFLTRLRREGQIPGVLYGHGEPLAIKVPGAEVSRLLAKQGPGGLVELEVNGEVAIALLKEISKHPASGEISNLGFQRVSLEEMITVRVPVTISGTESVVEKRGVAEAQLSELEIQCRADALPSSLSVDLSEAEVGDTIRVGEIALPEGVQLAHGVDPEAVVVSITMPAVTTEEEEEEELTEEELAAAEAAGEEAAEGEKKAEE